MVKTLPSLLLALICGQVATTAPGNEAELALLVARDARVQRLATGMSFTEGPIWMPDDDGFVLFTDMNNARLKRWDTRQGLTTFRESANNPNGNTRDLEGRLITCEHTTRRVTITDKDGNVRVLVDRYEGKRLNSPNDVVVKSDGTIWFTDPPYGLRGQPRELDKNYVFRFDPRDGRLSIVTDKVEGPNGLAFSPDEKRLYIADNGQAKNIRIFEVIDGTRLADLGILGKVDAGTPDGIKVDEAGNVWSSQTGGIIIFSPDARLIGRIPVPEVPSNLCFGGPDGKTLFITARASLYSIPVRVRGAGRPG